jgi:prepilin-type N-terminal cleavage/methylation domain-containing protein
MTRRSGFTLMELMCAATIMGVGMALGAPKMQKNVFRTNLRSAIAQMTGAVAATRMTAANRGCAATLHYTTGTAAKLWITSCKTTGAAGLDTVSADKISARYKVSVAAATDSVRFTPNGVRSEWVTTTIRFSHQSMSLSYSVQVDALGRVIR